MQIRIAPCAKYLPDVPVAADIASHIYLGADVLLTSDVSLTFLNGQMHPQPKTLAVFVSHIGITDSPGLSHGESLLPVPSNLSPEHRDELVTPVFHKNLL